MKHTEVLNIPISGPLFHLLSSTFIFWRGRKEQPSWIVQIKLHRIGLPLPSCRPLAPHPSARQYCSISPAWDSASCRREAIVHLAGVFQQASNSEAMYKIYPSQFTVIGACIHQVTYPWWMPDQIVQILCDGSLQNSWWWILAGWRSFSSWNKALFFTAFKGKNCFCSSLYSLKFLGMFATTGFQFKCQYNKMSGGKSVEVFRRWLSVWFTLLWAKKRSVWPSVLEW